MASAAGHALAVLAPPGAPGTAESWPAGGRDAPGDRWHWPAPADARVSMRSKKSFSTGDTCGRNNTSATGQRSLQPEQIRTAVQTCLNQSVHNGTSLY